MKRYVIGLLAAALCWSAAQAAPPPPPPPAPPRPLELNEAAVDSADFGAWRTRADEQEKAEADRKAAEDAVRKAKNRKARKAASDRLTRLAKVADTPDPFLIRAQILLDRAHASPGVIDGRNGDNLKKALHAFREMRGLPLEGGLDPALWEALSKDAAKATKRYVLYPEDVNGRYAGKRLPADYAKLAKLDWLSFADIAEMLGERFHVDPNVLRALNPGVDFKTAGVAIVVPDVGAFPEGVVRRITVDKKLGELRAYDDAGKIILIAPATIGSPDTPSPEGKMTINGSFPDPHYIYDPKLNFQQGKNRRKLTLPPGPNGPVGAMWIDLSKPTYGIHGTPEPSQISKTASHGCVRLTNWDAMELGRLIQPKVTEVEFQ